MSKIATCESDRYLVVFFNPILQEPEVNEFFSFQLMEKHLHDVVSKFNNGDNKLRITVYHVVGKNEVHVEEVRKLKITYHAPKE